MKFKKKKYLAILDIVITEIVSQKLQINLIRDFLKKKNSDLVFYSAESHSTFENLNVLKLKIKEKIKIDGIVFYSLLQFFYGGKKNINIINQILKKKIELIFIREGLSIKNKKQLENYLIEIQQFPNTHKSLIQNLKKNFLKILKK